MSDETRGHAIKARRLGLGIKSLREFAEKTGVDRAAITKAEDGQGSSATYDRLEAWLSRFEEETGHDEDSDDRYIEFRLSGVFGIDSIVVRGPVGDAAELEESVAKLLRELRERDQ
jgi:transcriptional regulator with XRE-family HTH domain